MKGQNVGNNHPLISSDSQSALLGHELGNVLNGLLGMAELLGETGLDAQQSQWLKAIVHSGLQMQALIQPGRFSDRQQDSNPGACTRKVDGVQLLEQVLTSHTPAARFRGNTLYVSMSPDVPRYWDCDPCMVRQLLDNVLGNAIKFTLAGKVHVEVLAVSAGQTLLLRISDTGPGFGKQGRQPDRIAESGGAGQANTGPGNQGFGLYICRQITRSMKGDLRVGGSDKSGACIEISLPEVLPDDAGGQTTACSVFRMIRCGLNLSDPLRLSVQNILERLGVEWTCNGLHPSGDELCIELGEARYASMPGGSQLLLTPVVADPSGCAPRMLAMPLFESTLGSVLLEIAIEWRRSLRNGNPGSTRSRR